MGNRLEDFIRENRSLFNDKEPPDRIWSGVENSLRLKRKIDWWNSVSLWRVAALLLMGFSIYLLIPSSPGKPDTASLREFQDVEAFYIREIMHKEQLIDQFRKMERLNGFTKDFHQLEAMYMVLKEEMKTRPSKKVKDALVLNLLIRIDLLNQQLHKLEEYEAEDPAEPLAEEQKANS